MKLSKINSVRPLEPESNIKMKIFISCMHTFTELILTSLGSVLLNF